MHFNQLIKRITFNSKAIKPLIMAFISLTILVNVIWLTNNLLTRPVYKTLEKSSLATEKMLLINKLVSIADDRTHLTARILMTKDFVERDEHSLQLDASGTQFTVIRRQLLAMPLNKMEKNTLNKQQNVINKLLPRLQIAQELAMSEHQSDVDKAEKILYNEVIPAQEKIIDLFEDILNHLQLEVTTSTTQMMSAKDRNFIINLVLILIFLFATILVAFITIRRILDIESTLNKNNQELSRLNNVKNDFVSLVSHELRTPLTSIKSFAEILLDDIEDMDTETQKRYLGIIDSEGDRLSRLVSNILDIQKIDANKMEWHNVNTDLNIIAQKCIDTYQGAYKAKNLELKIELCDRDLPVYLDVDKITQVFSNFLSNAIKFTEQGSVTLKLSAREETRKDGTQRNLARIVISDTGIGIPEEQLNKVFEQFHQVDNSETRKSGGSGLGLNICYKIINYYEGAIWVKSVVGEGSSFYIELPLTKKPQKMIGETLIELGMITDDQLKIALEEHD